MLPRLIIGITVKVMGPLEAQPVMPMLDLAKLIEMGSSLPGFRH